jgi:hypothetical protein
MHQREAETHRRAAATQERSAALQDVHADHEREAAARDARRRAEEPPSEATGEGPGPDV